LEVSSGQIALKTPSQKTHHKKKAGGVAQVAENLPSKCETLCSNPSATKKKRRRKRSWSKCNKNVSKGDIELEQLGPAESNWALLRRKYKGHGTELSYSGLGSPE
jgi:hypothetical protein